MSAVSLRDHEFVARVAFHTTEDGGSEVYENVTMEVSRLNAVSIFIGADDPDPGVVIVVNSDQAKRLAEALLALVAETQS